MTESCDICETQSEVLFFELSERRVCYDCYVDREDSRGTNNVRDDIIKVLDIIISDLGNDIQDAAEHTKNDNFNVRSLYYYLDIRLAELRERIKFLWGS